MKVSVSTTLDVADVKRVKVLVETDVSTPAAILRKAILKGLPLVEREVLGRVGEEDDRPQPMGVAS